MELITILNRCHRFRGLVYQHAYCSADEKSIVVAVRPRKGSTAVCSRCHFPAPGYDQLAERRFEFIPLWGGLVFLLYTMRRVDCRRCGVVAVEKVPWGDGKRTLTRAYPAFLTRFEGTGVHKVWTRHAEGVRRDLERNILSSRRWRGHSCLTPHSFPKSGQECGAAPLNRATKLCVVTLCDACLVRNADWEAQPGPLLDFGNLFYYGNLNDINTGTRTFERWFNTDNFERNSAKSFNSFHKRVFPTRIDGLRAGPANIWNANIQREIKFTGRLGLQLRLDVLNLTNRSHFTAPDTNPLSRNFGKVTNVTLTNKRFVPVQARLRF